MENEIQIHNHTNPDTLKTIESAHEIINAPFTIEQVERLNYFQRANIFHPYTCGSGNRTDANHLDSEGLLVATTAGWICPYCDYKQNWCSAFMVADGLKEYVEAIKGVKKFMFNTHNHGVE